MTLIKRIFPVVFSVMTCFLFSCSSHDDVVKDTTAPTIDLKLQQKGTYVHHTVSLQAAIIQFVRMEVSIENERLEISIEKRGLYIRHFGQIPMFFFHGG